MFIFILVFVLGSTFFSLEAKFDNLQEWTIECFKNYREYSNKGDFTESKSVLAYQDFYGIIEEFNNKIEQSSNVVKITHNQKFKWDDKARCTNVIEDISTIDLGQEKKVQDSLYHIEIVHEKKTFVSGEVLEDATKIYPHIEKIKLEPGCKVCFIGDIHGSIHSLLRNLLRLVALGYLKNDFSIAEGQKFYMVFLGDYVDRGRYSVEVIYTLLKLKLKNMDKVFLLRGNHEIKDTYSMYGFTKELYKKFPVYTSITIDQFRSLEALFDNFCNLLPLALFIGSGKDPANNNNPFWLQCCHGGIEPTFKPNDLKSFLESDYSVFNLRDKLYQVADDIDPVEKFKSKFSETDMNNGFTWCDFEENNLKNGLQARDTKAGFRGYAICGSGTTLKDYLNKYKLQAIFRGHQHSTYGLKIGGETHWEYFKEMDLLGKAKERNKAKEIIGFKISEVDYPVFTFSTASEGVALPYDCFGILTTAEMYGDWRLLPYELQLEIPSNPIKTRYLTKDCNVEPIDRDGKYITIKNFKTNVEPLEDPIEFYFGDKPASQPMLVTIPEAEPEKKPTEEIKPGELALRAKLTKLKESLGALKAKLWGLEGKLKSLKKALK